MAKTLKIRDLTLRDGQQSSFATRMTQAQIDRCLPYYKDANFYAMEVWGGAVPDSVMRYLNENPWTRLETIHKAVGGVSKLTALSRGRNLFGYAPYTDQIIDGFCRNAIQSGHIPWSAAVAREETGVVGLAARKVGDDEQDGDVDGDREDDCCWGHEAFF